MLNLSKETKTVVVIMIVLVVIGLLVAKTYYENINASEDPRVLEAKTLYEKYNIYTEENDYEGVFQLLDSIKDIYSKYPDYKNSYEMGVIYNNIGSTHLSNFLHKSSGTNKQTALDNAQFYFEKATLIYTKWLQEFENISEDELYKKVTSYYAEIDSDFLQEREIEKIKEKRFRDILKSKIETPRRLSVTYTNLGIIYRHKMQYDKAIALYQKALVLWDDNLTAKNNINILLGRELEERSTIEKLFPGEKLNQQYD